MDASMNVYWLEQTDADVPAENQWLSAGEMLSLGRMRFVRRRNDWRLGRWTAKRALAACLNVPYGPLALANIEIRAAASGAPEAFLFDQKAPVSMSLSHRAGTAMCAVALSGTGLGCDLELIEPRSNAFITDYLTVREQALVARTLVAEQPLLVNLLWSAKESALKALQVGLRVASTRVDVSLGDWWPSHTGQSRQDLPLFLMQAVDPRGWRPLHVRYSGEQLFCGLWRQANGMVRTLVPAFPLHCSSSEPVGPAWPVGQTTLSGPAHP